MLTTPLPHPPTRPPPSPNSTDIPNYYYSIHAEFTWIHIRHKRLQLYRSTHLTSAHKQHICKMTQINHLLLQLWDGQSLLLQTLGQQLLVGSLWFYQLLHHSETDKTHQFSSSFPNQWTFPVFQGVLVVVFNCNIYDKRDKREIASNHACAPCLVSHVIFVIAFACVSLHVCRVHAGVGWRWGGCLHCMCVGCMHASARMSTCECMHASCVCVCVGGGGAVIPTPCLSLWNNARRKSHSKQQLPASPPVISATTAYTTASPSSASSCALMKNWQLPVTSGGCNVCTAAVAVHWWKTVTCHFWRLQHKHDCSGSALMKNRYLSLLEAAA